MSVLLAVDVGGTFTDLSFRSSSGLKMYKVRSTHDAVSGVLDVLLSGLAGAGVAPSEVDRILHATTVATNAIFERTGAETAFVTTAGFGDVVSIGREIRSGSERFEIAMAKPDPFVPPHAIYELPERMGPDGSIETPLDRTALEAFAESLSNTSVESLAVCFLHAYRNGEHEQAVKEIVQRLCPDVHVILSSDVSPEPGEYERAMTAIVSAYISPLVIRYVNELQGVIHDAGMQADLIVVGSDGTGTEASQLHRRPIACLESGPVAGVMAGKQLAKELDLDHCLTLDIGGTTSKAGVIWNGRAELTKDFRVGGQVSGSNRRSADSIPVRAPVVDLAELGIGGGSIASVDAAGLLGVGPNSAGADPGPACFGISGIPTLTDADLVVGILRDQPAIGGGGPLDFDRARDAFASISRRLGVDPVGAAAAVREVANAEIAATIQRLLFKRGIDPEQLTMIAFGGTGPMHAAEVAGLVGMPAVIVPMAAGVFTTFGLLASELGMECAEHCHIVVTTERTAEAQSTLELLEAEARDLVLAHGDPDMTTRVERSASVCFRHQVQTLPIDLPNGDLSDGEIGKLFEAEYFRQFAISSDDEVVIRRLAVRVVAEQGVGQLVTTSEQWHVVERAPTYLEGADNQRQDVNEYTIRRGESDQGDDSHVRSGPALVRLPHSTALVPQGWEWRMTTTGDVFMRPT